MAMERIGLAAVLVGVLVSPVSSAAAWAAPPEDGAGAFATGQYRNLFAEAGHSEAEIDARIARAWRTLFEGNPETERLFTPQGSNENGPLAYIPDIQHTDVRSEGMSYGMMIAVQLDKKAAFDALWNWSLTHMYQGNPSQPSAGFFSWQMAYDGSALDELPAPDGEEYYAMALYFAANRWGSGKGIYDYKARADRLLHDMVHRETITAPVRQRGAVRLHTVGKEVNDEHAMILFSPDERNGFTDASYHLPAFYELWARWGPQQDRAFWARAAEASRDLFVKAADPKTGLVPNLSNFDGTPWSLRGPDQVAFREDAWRVASNWSVDWSWWAKDPRQRELSDRLQAFLESQGMESYGDMWKLDGTLLRDRHSPGLVATSGVASLAASDAARARRFTDALWNLEVPSSKIFRYYDGLLYMMSLLHASGRFRAIPPKPQPPAAATTPPLAAGTSIAPGVDLIRGRFVPNEQPDGNSVLFRAPGGFVVVDTGRHPEHAQAIVDFAKARKTEIAIVVNTHWHLDHVGGNPIVRRAYPGVHVYASGAILDALNGFLADYRAQLQSMIAKTKDPAAQRPWRAEVALIDAGPELRPDVKIEATRDHLLRGRKLRIGYAPNAVTAGDLWVFDPSTHVLAAGDLVTLPVPLLDTACPAGWQKALGEIAALDFEKLVPGHGEPMTRKGFETYRSAFDGFLACADSKRAASECSDGWQRDAAPLLQAEDPKFVRTLLGYYVDLLRKDPARVARLCAS